MINSMTGYGRAQKQIGQRTVTAELKSVNNRYFDCSVRTPRMCAYLEEPVKARVKSCGVARGKVEVNISVEYTAGDGEVCVNAALAGAYVAALREFCEQTGIQDDLTASAIARLPDIFTVKKLDDDREKLLSDVDGVLTEAVAAFNAMREAEGGKLADDLLAKLALLEADLELVELRMPQIVAEYRERLLANIRELLGDRQADEGRVLTEAAIFADRVATDEETVRLHSHLAQFRAILAEGGAAGRKLDFLTQEINREINTIGSKASDLEVARTIVEMKAELEKIREQIQNIE